MPCSALICLLETTLKLKVFFFLLLFLLLKLFFHLLNSFLL